MEGVEVWMVKCLGNKLSVGFQLIPSYIANHGG
jgi:hypothetical protein